MSTPSRGTAGRNVAMTNLQKAAVVLLQLGQERAAKVMALLSDAEVEEVSAEIVRMENIQPTVAKEVMRDFHQKVRGNQLNVGHGGMDYARRLLEASLGPEKAAEVVERLSVILAGQPFDFLQQADGRQVQSLISGEHPQLVALVLAHLRADRASAIMTSLPVDQRAEVAHRIATMQQASPEVIDIVAANLQRKATALITTGEYTAVGGIQPLVDILNRADPTTEKQVLDQLKERDESLAEQVRGLMFTFEDILLLEDRAVQLVVREIEVPVLAVALKGASATVRDKIMSNLSERMRESLSDEIEVAGAVRMSQVQEARGLVVATIRRFEESGQIVIRRDGEDDYVQ